MPSAPTLVTLVWLGVAPRHSGHDAELARFASAHHVRFQDAPNAPPALAARFPGYDPAIAEELEAILEKARLAAGALDGATALTHVESAERVLRAHAELPQAAWLMAERLHIEAIVLERLPAERARAHELHRAAQILEGERAPVYRPDGAGAASVGPAQELAPPVTVTVRVSGLRPGDALEWDGRSVRAPLRVVSGLHHVRIVRRGELALAEWIHVEPSAPAFVLEAPAPAPCSAADLTPVRIVGGRILAPQTRCRSWAVARPTSPAALEIALCSGSRCGSWTPTRAAASRDRAPVTRDERSWRTWAPYALGGLAVLATTGVVLWRLGAFDREQPEDRVLFTGPSALTF